MRDMTMNIDEVEMEIGKIPLTEEGYEMLLEVIRSDEVDIGTLASVLEAVFSSFEEYMSDSEREELVEIMKDNYDLEMIQLVWGDILDEYEAEGVRDEGEK